MQLLGDQPEALRFILDFVSNPEIKQAVLKGYAGVGKTALVGYALEMILDPSQDGQGMENVCIAAPTHKALDVLRQKCGHLPVTFKTLHALLGVMVRKTDEGDTEQDRWDPDLNFTLVCVDEGSMENAEFAKLLTEAIKSGKIGKVLHIGDPAQLPPVKEELSPIFSLPHTFEMTKVIRYDGAIIKVATYLRECITSGDSFSLADLMPFITPEDRSVSLIKRDAMYNWAMKARTANLDCRIVAWTNATVNNHNARMHSLLFPEAPFFGEGERALLGDSYTLRASTRDQPATEQDSLLNGELVTVLGCDRIFPKTPNIEDDKRAIVKELEDRAVVIYQVCAERDTGQTFVVWVAQNEERRAFVHKQLNDEIYNLGREQGRGDLKYQFLVKVRKQINRLCPLRHSYASTVHKTQGSTYDISMVDFGDIYRSEDRARLMYVAATRPSKFLVFAR